MYNKIILVGRLVKDPEVKYTSTGKVNCSFTLAVDRPYAGADGKREADFIPVIVWGKSAEACGNNLAKGKRALVEGRLQIRSYDAKDGSKRWVSEVISASVQFIDYGNGAKNDNAGYQKPAQAQGFDAFGTTVPEQVEIAF